jgi:sarcosine oxidase, subunit beta
VPADSAEVAILGAGIAGCALAHHLAGRSVGPIVVHDPGPLAAGATGRAAGLVTEQLWDPWDVRVVRDTKQEYAELARRGDPSAYEVTGFLRWTSRPETAAAVARAAAQLRRWGVEVELLDADGLARHLPGGRLNGVRAGLWSPGDSVVTPSAMAELYAAAAGRAGVDFSLGAPLTRLRKDGDRWELTLGGRSLRAATLVVAAGAWSKGILRGLGAPAPLTPYRTQAAVLRPSTRWDGALPCVHDLDDDVYARPEANGRILAGDGTELVEVDPERFRLSADDEFVAHLASSFERWFPPWSDAELVRAWAGVCVATPDRRPLIGPVPGFPGLHLLTGFNGFGVMRAAGAARRLAALLAAGDGPSPAAEELSSVLPGRFDPSTPAFPPRPGFTLEGGRDPRF